jgi:hypothetical protein
MDIVSFRIEPSILEPMNRPASPWERILSIATDVVKESHPDLDVMSVGYAEAMFATISTLVDSNTPFFDETVDAATFVPDGPLPEPI